MLLLAEARLTDSLLHDAGMIATAFGIVAAGAIPLGCLARLLARRLQATPILQPWRPFSTQWTGTEAILLFVLSFFARQFGIWGSLAMMPLFIWGFNRWQTRTKSEPARAVATPQVLADVAIAVRTWLVVTPVVFLVHFASLAILISLGGKPDEHPLNEASHGILFLSGCLIGPFYEELMFRRVLVPWAMGRHYRPWLIHLTAILGTYLAVTGSPDKQQADLFAPLGFVAVLSVSLLGIQALPRIRPAFPIRTVSSIWATATFFAIMHSGVWPTPIPLFILGLGLGWLMARQRSLLALILTHGLFNAVSVVHLFRGGT